MAYPKNKVFGVWLIDSGASHHLCAHVDLIVNQKESHILSVRVATSAAAPVCCMGDVCLSLGNRSLLLKDVLVVPSIVANLVSVSRLTDQGVTVRFDTGVCYALLKDQELVIGHMVNGVYQLGGMSVPQAGMCAPALSSNQEIGLLWHRRFKQIWSSWF
jgi:hypothetical protein